MISELQSCTELIDTHLLASYCSRIDVRDAQASCPASGAEIRARLQKQNTQKTSTYFNIPDVELPETVSAPVHGDVRGYVRGRDASRRP